MTGTSDGLALAAKSLTVYGYYLAPDAEKKLLYERAVAASERVVKLAPRSAEAHLRSAHSMGRYAQLVGLIEALSEVLAVRTRDAIEATLALGPEFPDAHLALAGWNAEIVAASGLLVPFCLACRKRRQLSISNGHSNWPRDQNRQLSLWH